ncbi:TOG array regulator of axonemal microtubules protein 2-like [Catharus ustulatus]|uniref:TOG array regulator of axonemal microtubules protein 2-like n=1 Tax=Catharus ustulatus TaxID=91951 RepID=UPI00140B1995|nr:TOG array regulator of axonemal microtubules protein 2-like [Catharus ustulatus]
MLQYQALLREQDDIELKTTNHLNPAEFLRSSSQEEGGELTHDCVEIIEQVYASRKDLKDEPLENPEWELFTDGSSFVENGTRYAGYAVVTLTQIIEARALTLGTSAQKAEIQALKPCYTPEDEKLAQFLQAQKNEKGWEKKEKGLLSIKHLAESHSEVLLSRLRDICLAVTSEVTNLRTKVSYSAIVTLGEFFVTLKKDMDSEVDEVARVLLQVLCNCPEFVEKAASQTLGMMVENVTPARAVTALLDSGVRSRHVQVRQCAAELLLSLMERIGVTELAGTARAERLAHAAATLAQDCHKDTR